MSNGRIAVVGTESGFGGREHALQERCRLDHYVTDLLTPTQALAADPNAYGLYVIGPEQPLVDGLADELRTLDKRVFGPSKDHARLEGSKIFMKRCLAKAGIMTARWSRFAPGHEADLTSFMKVTEQAGWNGWVVKTDYLAGGKGVFVTDDPQAAIADARKKLEKGSIVIEEKLVGREVSFFAIVSGNGSVRFTPSAQDYKRLMDGDEGPNTGGMGSYSPLPADMDVSLEERTAIVQKLLSLPELKGYTGVLFGGLMITDDGIYVLEFNIRFGDPEIQSILPRIDENFAEVLFDAAMGEPLPQGELAASGYCVTVVLASEGYPNNPQVGRRVFGLMVPRSVVDLQVLPAGITYRDGVAYTSGGRFLNLVGCSEKSLGAARYLAYTWIDAIRVVGAHYRTDIALEALGLAG